MKKRSKIQTFESMIDETETKIKELEAKKLEIQKEIQNLKHQYQTIVFEKLTNIAQAKSQSLKEMVLSLYDTQNFDQNNILGGKYEKE